MVSEPVNVCMVHLVYPDLNLMFGEVQIKGVVLFIVILNENWYRVIDVVTDGFFHYNTYPSQF